MCWWARHPCRLTTGDGPVATRNETKLLGGQQSTGIQVQPRASNAFLACHVAVVTSDPDLRVRPGQAPSHATEVTMVQAQPRTAGPAGACVPPQGQAVGRRRRWVRDLDHDVLALNQPSSCWPRGHPLCGGRCGQPGGGAWRRASDHGMKLQVIASAGGTILWVSGELPSSTHDTAAAQIGMIPSAGWDETGGQVVTPYTGRNKPESQKGANRAYACADPYPAQASLLLLPHRTSRQGYPRARELRSHSKMTNSISRVTAPVPTLPTASSANKPLPRLRGDELRLCDAPICGKRPRLPTRETPPTTPR